MFIYCSKLEVRATRATTKNAFNDKFTEAFDVLFIEMRMCGRVLVMPVLQKYGSDRTMDPASKESQKGRFLGDGVSFRQGVRFQGLSRLLRD
ncbi:hypothetical protein L1987_61169 [Smallanthus sonchifolius]|uniref:Uncharacterized protein n=1 Tax=Smallanthus sonchifolius TaxID=185202 RepID=A0ACB9DA92_9ASTR|nr:hypothetical protein L1987_61169 [Smallanthus sonchifolius]